MKELIPCPFCGSSDLDISRITATWFNIDCNNCSACISGNSRDEAINNWNTRAENTCTLVSSLYDEVLQEYVYELSCGHDDYSAFDIPPRYCAECGARVEEE